MKKNLLVFGITLFLAGVPAAWHVLQSGVTEESLGLVLRISARLALLIYLLVFITRPLHQLSASPQTRKMLSNRRYFGISFSAVMTVHLALLIWLNGFVIRIPGMITFLLIYMMLITSFPGPAAALGPSRWRILHKTGLYWIGTIFSIIVISDIRETPGEPVYLLLVALMLAALAIRVGAYLKFRGQFT